MDFTVAAHFGVEVIGEGVDAFGADAVQTAGNLVGAGIEFAAGMEVGENDLQGGETIERTRGTVFLLLGKRIARNAAAVILDAAISIRSDGDFDMFAEAGHCLIDGIVDDFVDAVVEASFVGVADVHWGTQTDGVREAQDGDIFGGILFLRVSHLNAFANGFLRLQVVRFVVGSLGI